MTEGQQPAVLSRGDQPELRRFVPSGQQKHKTCVFVLQGFSIWFTCRETRKVGTAFPERGKPSGRTALERQRQEKWGEA